MGIDLTGRTAIVTGAGRGIGAVIATTFAEAGANVVAAARSADELEATVEAVEAAGADEGVEGLAVETDLREEADIDRLVEAATDAFGVPEILVNNAGANFASPPLDQSTEEVDAMLDVNLRGVFLLSTRWASAFRESDAEAGRIVTIASIAGHVGVPAMTLYGGTKSGLFGVTRGLAAELSGDDITVNTVSPGLIRVERTQQVMDATGDDLFDYDRIPAGRVGEPEDVANACLFLASDLASYVTGTDLLVDGGVDLTAGLYR